MSPAFARLAGAAAVAALALPLAAQADTVHVMSVALPDGSVARIHYVGEVPPTLTMAAPPAISHVAMERGTPFPFIPAAFVPPADADPFAALARMDAAMQQEADALLLRASAMANAAPPSGTGRDGTGLVTVGLGGDASGACVEGTRITAVNGAAPQVVSFRSAGCGAVSASPTAAFGSAPGFVSGRTSPTLSQPDAVPGSARALPDPTPKLVEASDDGSTPLALLR